MQRARTHDEKGQRRDALLAAALNVFFEKGYAAARLDDIAARAGVSKGTIYLYFESKEDLFLGLIESVALPRVERVLAQLDSVADLTMALDRMAALAPVLIRDTDMPRLLKVLIGDSQTFPPMVTRWREGVIEPILAHLAELLSRASEQGDCEIADPALTARLVVAPILLSAIWQAVFSPTNDAVDLDTLFQHHRDMLLRGLGVKGAP